MTSGETVLHIGHGMDALTRALTELGCVLDAAGITARARFQAELVFEEIITNVIRYGYDDDETGLVDMTVRIEADDIVLVVSDDGRPFNPLDRPEPALPGTLADARIGGLGIMLVRKAAHRLSYEREGGRNRLTIVLARA